MDNSFKYIKHNKGIDSEKCYHYKGEVSSRISPFSAVLLLFIG